MARRFALVIALAIAATPPAAASAAAQSSLSVSIALPAPGARPNDGPTVTVANMLEGSRNAKLLASSFVGRMTITVELWESHRWIDEPLGQVLWQRVVKMDGLTRIYRTAHSVADSLVEDGRFATLDDVRKALSAPHIAPAIPTTHHGTMYYMVNVTVETLNSNDLAEVKRWLSGEVQPMIHGQRNPVVAAMSALQTIGSRLLGGDVKKASQSSAKFRL